MFQNIEHQADYVNWDVLAMRDGSLLGDGLGIGQLVVSNCFTRDLSFLGLISVSIFVLFLCIIIISFLLVLMIIIISIIKLFLSQSTDFPFFPGSAPHPTRRE